MCDQVTMHGVNSIKNYMQRYKYCAVFNCVAVVLYRELAEIIN
jgi:hypothetical protein